MSQHFDVAVLGAGPGGYVAALRAGQLGATVAIVEKHHLGGTCLNYGCIPSKSLLASAELLHRLQHADALGLEVSGHVGFNWPKIQARKDTIVQGLRLGVKSLLKARKATIFEGQGVLNGTGKIVVTNGGESERFTASKVILATGSLPARIPGWPSDLDVVCTSDEAVQWKSLPARLLIVGGGVIGCELACMMQAFGVEVTIVEMLPRLLPSLDRQVTDTLTKVFVERGIAVYAGVTIEDLTTTGNGIRARMSNGQVITADRAFVAIGRRPNVAAIDPRSVGLATDRGFVPVNDLMETPVSRTIIASATRMAVACWPTPRPRRGWWPQTTPWGITGSMTRRRPVVCILSPRSGASA